MKINIKKFMELTNVSFETPAKIEAGHDVGKSTIFRAVLFTITGKDFDGKEFDGRIYPKNAKSVSDLTVEVEIEQNGVVFCKKANGTEKRTKGSDETEMQRSVTAVYMIDFQVVKKDEYDLKVQETFLNFQLFSNPDYFRNLKKEDKRVIFANLIDISKPLYFDGLGDKKTISGKIKAQKDEIDACNAKLSELSKVQQPTKISIVDYSEQLADLRTQRQNATPELSLLQVEANNEINRQISELEKSEFIPKPTVEYLPEPKEPEMCDIEDLKKELQKVQLSEPDDSLFVSRIAQMRAKIGKIKALQLQIDNYNENIASAKCTICQVCAAPNCEYKRIELATIDELHNEMSKLMDLKTAERSLENLEAEQINYLRKFEDEKQDRIFELEIQIRNGIEDNDNAAQMYFAESNQIREANTQLFQENQTIQAENSKNRAQFETLKAEKIAELKSKIHSLPDFDYSEIDNQILEIVAKRKVQQEEVDGFNELQGAYNYAQNRITILSADLEQMKQALYSSEREMIKIEDAENRYYSDFESLINAEMPENVHVSLFKKNLSNDDYSECFEIEFNGSIYAGNGKTIAFYIWLCSWFQSKFEKDLPIFIDEAIILNESLYSDVKNTVILMRNDECKTLKITEL
jgi:chromosome segregation ATPase